MRHTITLYPPAGGPPVEALKHQAEWMIERGWTTEERPDETLTEATSEGSEDGNT